MTVITSLPILTHLKDRLRANYVEEAIYSDIDVLALLNDAYRDACEQSRCLQELATITITGGTSEYALPAQTSQVLSVFAAGIELDRVSLGQALASLSIASYYTYGQTIGFSDLPTGTSSAVLLLAALPTPLANFESDFDPRFPIEYADVLVHYVRWRVQTTSGGAERLAQASIDRQIYDGRVGELRREATQVDAIGNRRLVTEMERVMGRAG